ncbi:MAG: hypothetical protein HGA85_03095 [Nanoarchaeota archaeon]|nr:hypothetical protein [Nanoarchaeota archaeon]
MIAYILLFLATLFLNGKSALIMQVVIGAVTLIKLGWKRPGINLRLLSVGSAAFNLSIIYLDIVKRESYDYAFIVMVCLIALLYLATMEYIHRKAINKTKVLEKPLLVPGAIINLIGILVYLHYYPHPAVIALSSLAFQLQLLIPMHKDPSRKTRQ